MFHLKKYLELNNELMRKKDNFFDLEKDIQAVKAFKKEVDEKLMKFNSPIDRIHWLIKNNYYIDFFAMYSHEEILKIPFWEEQHPYWRLQAQL